MRRRLLVVAVLTAAALPVGWLIGCALFNHHLHTFKEY